MEKTTKTTVNELTNNSDSKIIAQLSKLDLFAEWTSQEDWDAEEAINAIKEYDNEHSDLEESDGDTIEYSDIFELLVTWKQNLGFDKSLSIEDVREILESGISTGTDKVGSETEPFTELPFLTDATGEKVLGRIPESQFKRMSFYQSEMAGWFIGNGALSLEEARNYKITDEDIAQIAEISDFKEYFEANYHCAELGDLYREYIHELLSGILANDIERAEKQLEEIED